MKNNGNDYIFKTKEELYEFLYGCCTAEERKQLKIKIGQAILER